MKRTLIIVFILCMLFSMVGCKSNQSVPEPSQSPTVETDPAAESQTEAATDNPFEFESEIDFSEFETVPVTTPTEPEPTQNPSNPAKPTVKPSKPTVENTEPPVEPTSPDSTEPPVEETTTTEATEPEETEAPTSAKPSYEADGYFNQIVKP